MSGLESGDDLRAVLLLVFIAQHSTPKGVRTFRRLESYKHPTPPE
jgi:hypothetical protein